MKKNDYFYLFVPNFLHWPGKYVAVAVEKTFSAQTQSSKQAVAYIPT